jgi:membrane-anchored mycosin MYCP
VLLSDLQQEATGARVKVAVIDTGVDTGNPQLAGAVSGGVDLEKGTEAGGYTTDPNGHGTLVAGIIAARPHAGTGFQGIAPGAQILAIRAVPGDGTSNAGVLAQAIDDAVSEGADVINISQDVQANGVPTPMSADSALGQAVRKAVAAQVVVVVSAGNEGLGTPTYPGAFDGVLAVGASDFNDERASFSEYGSFVGVSAPGVQMLSTWPAGGQCAEDGTSFSAPYVAGVAALLKERHPGWTAAQIIARIEQTADRSRPGRDDYIGWGVVDPLRAVTDTAPPASTPTPDANTQVDSAKVLARPLGLGDTQQARDDRTAIFAVAAGLLLALLISGTAVVIRDAAAKRRR